MIKSEEKRFIRITIKTVSIMLILAIATASLVIYAFMQMQSGFAVLTSLPPEISGPYYIAAELHIYGPPVNLANIKSKMGGFYAADYSYVKWGDNPFYKVFADNTFQCVYYNTMGMVMDHLAHGFAHEIEIVTAYNAMKSSGALDPESERGSISWCGNLPGIHIVGNNVAGSTGTMNVQTSYWFAACAHSYQSWSGEYWSSVKLNYSTCAYATGYDNYVLNATGIANSFGTWTLEGSAESFGGWCWSLYFKDLLYFSTTMLETNYRIYNITASPGTGYVTKALNPPSPKAGTVFNVTAYFDTPSATNAKITEYYPNSFGLASTQVTLKRFKTGTGIIASTIVNVSPTLEGANMKFSISYNEAPTILQSISGDEYLALEYSLTAPTLAGEYTLPAAKIEYTIPIP